MRLSAIIVVLFFIQALHAQSEEFSFIGALVSSNNQAYTYKLKLKITDNSVEGYSITDVNGSDETKAKLFGTYNFKTGQLVFSETKVLYSKSTVTSFCLLSGNTKMSVKNKKAIINGEVWGLIKTDTCFKGSIMLAAESYVLNKLEKVEKTLKVAPISKTKKKESKASLKEYKDGLISNFITKGESVIINTNSDTCFIWIWDNEEEDGDEITLKVNGTPYLSNYVVRNKKKFVPLVFNSLRSSTLTVEVISMSEGRKAPNTAHFLVEIGQQRHSFDAFLRLHESAKIIIKKTP